jgi:hypothetical protein
MPVGSSELLKLNTPLPSGLPKLLRFPIEKVILPCSSVVIVVLWSAKEEVMEVGNTVPDAGAQFDPRTPMPVGGGISAACNAVAAIEFEFCVSGE